MNEKKDVRKLLLGVEWHEEVIRGPRNPFLRAVYLFILGALLVGLPTLIAIHRLSSFM